tara:strand:- start:405 stop:728 length:324 start_codon:yes stop_codon:yes gene_type:complete
MKYNTHMFTLVTELLSQGVKLVYRIDGEAYEEFELASSSCDLEGLTARAFNSLHAADYTEVLVFTPTKSQVEGWFSVVYDEGEIEVADYTIGMDEYINNALERATEV